jgi:hypothetical protein
MDKDDLLARQFPLLDATPEAGAAGGPQAEGSSDVATLEEGAADSQG